MKRNALLSLFCLSATVACTQVNGQLIAYDGFDGNATGFSSAFGSLDSGTSLGYANGGTLETVTGSSGGAFSQVATLSNALTSADNDTVWFSFISERKSTADDFRVDFVDAVGASQTGFSVSSQFGAGDDVDLTLVLDSGTFVDAGTIGSGVGLNFFAVEVNMDTGLINAYYNPSLSSGPGAVAASFTNSNAVDTGIGQIQLVFGTAYRFDEIRIGETFADVAPIPEPSAYALLAGALALGCVMVRRRS